MTAEESVICLALGNVRYLPASFDKRFGHNLHSMAHAGRDLSVSQKEWMYRLLYKYRKQLPVLYEFHKGHPHCSQKRKR